MERLINQWVDEQRAAGRWNERSARQGYFWGKHFAGYFKQHYKITSVGQIKPEHLAQYRKDRVNHLAAYTQMNEYKFLSSFFSWCIDRKLLLYSPLSQWRMPPRPQLSPRYLTTEQIRKILDAIDTTTPAGIQNRAIVEMFYATAIRLSELTALDLSDVDIAVGRVWIHHGKGDKGRIVPVIRSSLSWIREYLKHGRPELIKDFACRSFFLGLSGGRIPKTYIEKLMRQLRERTGITPLSAHVFRHSCASHLMLSEVPLPYIQMFLGHKKLETTQYYLHLHTPELIKIYELSHPRDKLQIREEKDPL